MSAGIVRFNVMKFIYSGASGIDTAAYQTRTVRGLLIQRQAVWGGTEAIRYTACVLVFHVLYRTYSDPDVAAWELLWYYHEVKERNSEYSFSLIALR